ncbi:MarR family winged helix-turn-helix transcriptional regulator [Cohnella soli]|uniref:MarR family winged helix-turn-helix transcriptional regulator n=1 Tax=Cohnella soli TaxID=425005 RepID=A0ABW0HRB2_9BACL
MSSDYRSLFDAITDAFNEYYTLYNKGAAKIDAYQLTVQQESILFHLMRSDRTTANDIASRFSITKSAVSQVLTQLESRGFIVRESNPNDRRESFILLGSEGQKYAALIHEADETFIREHLSQIDQTDLEQMLRTLKQFNAVIKSAKEKR